MIKLLGILLEIYCSIGANAPPVRAGQTPSKSCRSAAHLVSSLEHMATSRSPISRMLRPLCSDKNRQIAAQSEGVLMRRVPTYCSPSCSVIKKHFVDRPRSRAMILFKIPISPRRVLSPSRPTRVQTGGQLGHPRYESSGWSRNCITVLLPHNDKSGFFTQSNLNAS